MNRISTFFIVLAMTAAFYSCAGTFPQHSERSLWIETREHGKLKTTLAVTEQIARMVIESKDTKVNFSGEGKKDIITREQVRSVLDGDEKSVTGKDREKEVTISMKDLDVPGKKGGTDRLILETYKGGKKTFSITLPDIEVESKGDDDSGDLVPRSFGWKALLPFLAKSGGALYVLDHKDDSEVWLYVD